MSEILIKARDAHHPDPVEDARGCYKRGDPVLVMPSGHTWGSLETIPRFWRVRVPGERFAFYPFVEPHYTMPHRIWLRGENSHKLKTSRLLRRRWHFSAELIAPPQRLALYRGEIVDLTWSEFIRAMLDKSGLAGRKSLILELAA